MSATPREGRRFPETHWSQLRRAADAGDPRQREHLDVLLRRYWKPLYHYLRAMRRLDAADAEDLTQGFFAMVLHRVDLATLDPQRGSFRAFLKTALRRFVMTAERGAGRRLAREGNALPFAEAEAAFPADEVVGPDEAFDRAWAREVVTAMLTRLESELQAEGKRVQFEVFRAYCLDPEEGVSYASLARKHGVKEDDVRNWLRVVRQRGREIARELLGEYLLPGESVEAELAFVLGR